MAEKEEIFSSSVKYNGVFVFKDFYKFCYTWLMEETALTIFNEKKYSEKITPTGKEIKITWEGEKKLTDYFKFEIKVEFEIYNMVDVEINQDGKKIKANKAEIKVKTKGTLWRDYEGKFETTAFKKFLRAIYEKWVIPTRIEQFESYVIGKCDEFLSQSKAYLDLEGKR